MKRYVDDSAAIGILSVTGLPARSAPAVWWGTARHLTRGRHAAGDDTRHPPGGPRPVSISRPLVRRMDGTQGVAVANRAPGAGRRTGPLCRGAADEGLRNDEPKRAGGDP